MVSLLLETMKLVQKCVILRLRAPWGMPEGRRKASWVHFWKLVQKVGSLKGTKSFNFGSLFGISLPSWRHPESFMDFPDRKECHLLRLSIPDLILGLILDLPKCAEHGSRCSLSLVFTFLACFEIAQKWTPAWTFLRPEIAARHHLGASRTPWGSHFCASELKLKNVSKMYRIGCRFGGLEAGCPTVVSPSNLHGLSMVSPSNLHRISIEETSTPQRRGPLHIYQMLGIRRSELEV